MVGKQLVVFGQTIRIHSFDGPSNAAVNLLTPLFRVIDAWLPLPPLSLIAVLRNPPEQTAAPQTQIPESEIDAVGALRT